MDHGASQVGDLHGAVSFGLRQATGITPELDALQYDLRNPVRSGLLKDPRTQNAHNMVRHITEAPRFREGCLVK